MWALHGIRNVKSAWATLADRRRHAFLSGLYLRPCFFAIKAGHGLLLLHLISSSALLLLLSAYEGCEADFSGYQGASGCAAAAQQQPTPNGSTRRQQPASAAMQPLKRVYSAFSSCRCPPEECVFHTDLEAALSGSCLQVDGCIAAPLLRQAHRDFVQLQLRPLAAGYLWQTRCKIRFDAGLYSLNVFLACKASRHGHGLRRGFGGQAIRSEMIKGQA